MPEYDIEPDGLYFIYGVNRCEDGSKDRFHVGTVDVLDVAKAGADNATRAYDYCYVKQFGAGTVYFVERAPEYGAAMPASPVAAATPPSSVGSAAP